MALNVKKEGCMKRMVWAIALLACTVIPASAGNNNNQFQNWQHNRQFDKQYGNQYNQYNQYNYKYKNNNNYNGWQVGGAFLGGMLLGGVLNNDRGYYAPPPAYQEPYPQPYQPVAPRWAGPRYCESMLYYDQWGNLVQARDCYR